MATTKLYKWLLPVMLLISTASFAQFFPSDTRSGDILGQRKQGPVVDRDGTTRYPNGTIVYPDGTVVHPDGTVRYPNGRVERNNRYPDFDGRNNGRQCCNGCGMPPGQAKKKYGGHAKDYAKGKKQCKKHHDDDDDEDWDERNVRRYPQQYPQNPQYPQYPQNPRNGQKYPSGKNRQL
jgi:hypothetical protein